MRRSSLKIGLLFIVAVLLQCGEAFGQAHPERRHIRSGNKTYEQQDYAGAEERYRTALERVPGSYEAAFNLSDALYRQQKYDEAAQVLGQLAEREDLTPAQRARVMHNLGNVRFSQQQLQEAADCYKESLRARPDDLETKYNLAYVQQLLQQQQQQQQNQDQNQDQQNNQDQNQNGQNDQNDQNDQNKDGNDGQDQNRNQDQNQQNSQDQNQNGQNDQDQNDRQHSGDDQRDGKGDQDSRQQPNGGQGQISREDAESILDALQQQEDKTREKVNAQRAVSVGASGKNW